MTGIAVVIPCFNLGRFLNDAIVSVLRQTRAAAELVIVDDGSTDLYTRQFLASINYPNTRVVHTSNHGVSAARNYGIRQTSAEYVVTLDADDRLDLHYLESTAALLDNDVGLGFVLTGISTFGAATFKWTPSECTILNAWRSACPYMAAMFRRRVWAAAGGFDESRMIAGYENLDFWLSVMELGSRGDVIKEALLECRVRSDALHQKLVSSGGHVRAMEAVFRKHRETILKFGPDLLLERDQLLMEGLSDHRQLIERKSNLDGELHAIETKIAEATLELSQCGEQSLEWGDLARPRLAGSASRSNGTPLDIFYISDFLRRHTVDVRGDVLVIQEGPMSELDLSTVIVGAKYDSVTHHYGGLSELPELCDSSFNCVIAVDFCRTVYDPKAGLLDLYRILKANGTLLCVFPSVRATAGNGREDFDYWRFTEASVRHLCAEIFPAEEFVVSGYGNVMTSTASLLGLGAEDIEATERDFVDPMFPLLYCVRAVKTRDLRQDESS